MKYYASLDRLAVYKIDDEYKGYYINKKVKKWVEDAEVLGVPYDTIDNERIDESEALKIIEGWK